MYNQHVICICIHIYYTLNLTFPSNKVFYISYFLKISRNVDMNDSKSTSTSNIFNSLWKLIKTNLAFLGQTDKETWLSHHPDGNFSLLSIKTDSHKSAKSFSDIQWSDLKQLKIHTSFFMKILRSDVHIHIPNVLEYSDNPF